MVRGNQAKLEGALLVGAPFFCPEPPAGHDSCWAARTAAATMPRPLDPMSLRRFFVLPLLGLFTVPLMATTTFLYVGTSPQQTSRGIYVARFDTATGTIGPLELAAETRQPGFLALHPDRRHLYAIGETGEPGEAAGCLVAFAIDPADGRLTLVNRQPTGTRNPVHLALSRDGRTVLMASYSGAAATSLPVNPDGSLGLHRPVERFTGSSVHPERQKQAFPHSINFAPDDRFAFVCDLGTDAIVRFRVDPASGTLHRVDPPVAAAPGAGPRHLSFHPNGRWAYVINELDNTIAAYAYDTAQGELARLQVTSTLPDGFTGKHTAAEVRVHPNGRFLYGTNRGHDAQRLDSVAVYTIDQASGTLTFVERTRTGDHPRHFNLDPTGRWLLVSARESDRIEVYAINPTTGRLTPHGQPVTLSQPLNLQFYQP